MSAPSGGYTFDGFTVDFGQRRLLKGTSVVELPSRAFDTLVYLIERRDRCIAKDELIAAIWNDVAVTDDSLVHAVSVLRRALGDETHAPSYIQTVPRRGYRFIATVNSIDQQAAPPDTFAAASAAGTTVPRLPAFGWRRLTWSAGFASTAIALLALVGYETLRSSDPTAPPTSIRLYQPAPPDTDIVSGGVLSPNGRFLAFVARDRGLTQNALWLRSLHSDELRRLDGTTGASKPFWSPDSREIGYFANGKLHAIGVNGGDPRSIVDVFAAAGGAWADDGTILFAEWARGLFTVSASGDGAVETVATLERDAGDIAFAWPQFFHDNRRFLYQIISLDETRSGVHVGDLESRRSFRLLDIESPAVLAPPNFLLHVENDMLIAEELHPDHPELTGRAILVARGLSAPSLAAGNVVSASADLLAFQQGVARAELAWFNRDGQALGSLRVPAALYNPRLAPDESKLLASSSVTTDPGLWLVSLDREEYVRLETDAIGPVWSPDGRQVAFTSRDGFDLYVRSIEGSEERRRLTSGDSLKVLNDWSPDGSKLVYTRYDREKGLDLWLLDVATASEQPLLATFDNETQARISPDGRWIAYASDATGMLQIYVARFPDLSERRAVSVEGGGQPNWRADQTELYYLALDSTLMAISIDGRGPMSFEAPQALFRAAVAGDPADARDYFAVAASGEHFLVAGAASEHDGQAITILVDWANGAPERRDEPAHISQAAVREP